MANIALKANVPGDEKAIAGTTTAIPDVSISDPQLFGNGTVTVKLTTATGLLGATAAGSATVTGTATTALTIKGTLADVNSTLATLTYLCPGADAISSDTITVQASDSAGAGDQEQISISVTPIPAFATDSATLDFKTADQSMWTSGQALDINYSINLLQALSIPDFSGSLFDGDLTYNGSITPQLIFDLAAKTGGISLDYPVDGGIVIPNAVAPGQQFVVQTLDNGVSNATLKAVFPTFSASLTAGLDVALDATIDSDLLPGSPYDIDFNADPTKQLFDVQSGDKKTIGFDGVGSLDFLIPKDYDQTSTTTGTGGLPTVTTNAETPNFISANVELLNLLSKLGVPIPPLSGSLLGGAVTYDIASATLHAGIDIAQQFQFVPTGINVTITPHWADGTTTAPVTVPIGDSATFTVPTDEPVDQPVTITTSYTLTGNLVSNTGIAGNADLAISVLSGHVEYLGSFGPLYSNDFPVYQGSPLYLVGPGDLVNLAPFPLDGLNTVSQSTSIPVFTKIYAVTPGNKQVDTSGFSATASDTIQTAISTLGAKDSDTNIYNPTAGTGSAASDPAKFNIEEITSNVPVQSYALPAGFSVGIVEAGSGPTTLSDGNGGVLLAGADSGDTLNGVGNDTLVGGQNGFITFGIAGGFGGEIDGIEPGDVIDAAGAVTSANLDGNTLTLNDSGNSALYTIAVSGDDLADTKMVLTGDDKGGTDVNFYRYAAALVNNGNSTIVLPNVHQNAQNDQVGVTVTNVSRSPAESLLSFGGPGFVGSLPQAGLAPGQTSTADIQTQPLDTSQPGLQTLNASLAFISDGGSGLPGDSGQTDLTRQPFTITGAVYALAQPVVSNTFPTIHVGDSGVVPITVTNDVPANAPTGYYEDLLASVTGIQSQDNQMTASGSTADIDPGDSDSSSITVTVPTTTAGRIFGNVAIDFVSDGTNVDGLGTTSLDALDPRLGQVGVQVTVNDYAQPQWSLANGAGTLAGSGNAYTLDLGQVAQSIPNSLTPSAGPLAVLSLANAQLSDNQDQLAGTFAITGLTTVDPPGEFNNDGFEFAAGQSIGPGSSDANFQVSMSTGTAGTFVETIGFTPTSSNNSSTDTLAEQTITVTGTVVPPSVVAPATVTIPLNRASAISGVSIADLDPNGPTVTVELTDTTGLLSVDLRAAPGDVPGDVTGEGSTDLTISGSLDEVNALLATLTGIETVAGPDFIKLGGTTADLPVVVDGVPVIPGGSIPIVPGRITVNPNTLFDFTYTYANGKGSYSGTVADDGSLGYAAIAASASPTITRYDMSGNVAGTYQISAAGDSTAPNGTVTIDSYTDATSGNSYQFDHTNNGGADGVAGLGSESQQFYVNGVAHQFSPLQAVGSVPAPIPQPIEDFNADGTSDMLWQRGADGNLMVYGVVSDQVVTQPALGPIGGEWNYLGLGDFDADGSTDILWQRPSDGALMIYTVVDDVVTATPGIGQIGQEWTYKATGNFDGDRTADILWQRGDGDLMVYDVEKNVVTATNDLGHIGSEWTLLGTGDFNHDGSDGILWERPDGELMIYNVNHNQVTSTVDIGRIGLEWHYLGAGDFNGDGTTDILWLNAKQDLMVYQMRNDQVVATPVIGQFDKSLAFLDIGDYTGDGTDDILAQAGNGSLTVYNVENNKIVGTSSLGAIGAEWDYRPFQQTPAFHAGG